MLKFTPSPSLGTGPRRAPATTRRASRLRHRSDGGRWENPGLPALGPTYLPPSLLPSRPWQRRSGLRPAKTGIPGSTYILDGAMRWIDGVDPKE